jgi:hypothetical protein
MIRKGHLVAAGVLAAGVLPFAAGLPTQSAAANNPKHATLNCRESSICAEVANPSDVFGNYYVGHDEPSLLFYSDKPGSGNQMRYQLTLPTDPTPTNPNTPGKSYIFELNGAQWFGMAMCATESYPVQVKTCTRDSDSNIVDPTVSPNHPGTAFMELQFYSPGWIPWPTWQVAVGATTCDPTKWCAAVNIFSLAQDPVNHTLLGGTCAGTVGIEYVNFAFITLDGKPTAPPNPVDSTTATFTPDPNKDLFMNSGDHVQVTMHDTEDGLKILLDDKSTHQSGSMTTSAKNGFAQVKYNTDPNAACQKVPYDFHPMYSTSSEKTRTIWAAHSYNLSFTSEIGHFEFCNGPNAIPATPFGLDNTGAPVACPAGNTEERAANAEPTDADDNWCFPGTEALTVHINGCTDTNAGFDGAAYQNLWPDGNTVLHPTSVLVSSPEFGSKYNQQYGRVAFEADLPRIETAPGGPCNRSTGAGCTLIPQTDEGQPAVFYPWFSDTKTKDGCFWQFGDHIPGSLSDFGENAEWGTLLNSTYLSTGGATITRYNNFRQILSANPCKQG